MMDMPVRIPLLRGGFAFVDERDESVVSRFRWYEKRSAGRHTTYAYASDGSRRISMHRLILNAKPGQFVDHEDHNGLNNTRRNIRICTPQQNQMNVVSRTGGSKFKGVSWHKAASKWQAIIRLDGRNRYLGLHMTEEEAARAYDEAALRLFGEFARLNFPAEVTA